MDYLIRFVQIHETFRKPEIEALAILANVDVEFLSYSETVRGKPSNLNTPSSSNNPWPLADPKPLLVSILNRPPQRRSCGQSCHKPKHLGQSHLRIMGLRNIIQ